MLLRTILILIATLIALPFIAYRYDQPLGPELTETLYKLVRIMLTTALICFIVSELTRNYSQVDKLWSLMPILYVWVVAADSGFGARLCLMASLATIWGLRLTYNFGRRGGYNWIPWKGEEDYRWAVLRQNPALQNRLTWGVFNLIFISLYQQSLVLLFTLPSIVAWHGADRSFNWIDAVAALIMLTGIAIETLADQQQWEFQREKYRRINLGEPLTAPYASGFCQSGLWARVRHPNYAAEQSIWIGYYLFSVAATGRWINWSLAGVLLLMLLFLGSSDFSEKISAGKYPDYDKYRKTVPRFVPRLF